MLRSYLPARLRHWGKTLINSDYRNRSREIKRLRNLPRYEADETSLLGQRVKLVDAASFLSAYKAIFENEIYHFESGRPEPMILDCGANIGLAVFYWKQCFPRADITAFEPDPEVFAALEWNCNRNAFDDVKLVEKGVWSRTGTLKFWQEGADGGHILDGSADVPEDEITSVPVVRLRDYLTEPVDMLKLDIEGAETEVLIDCADRLHRVEHLFVEWHSFNNREQRVDEILRVLRQSGFRIHVHPELTSDQPFVEKQNSYGMDQRLNIFGYRS